MTRTVVSIVERSSGPDPEDASSCPGPLHALSKRCPLSFACLQPEHFGHLHARAVQISRSIEHIGTGRKTRPPPSQPYTTVILDRHIGQRNTQGIGNAATVRWIGVQAVTDVPNLDVPWRRAEGAGRVFEQQLPLYRRHQTEQRAGLRVLVRIFSMVPMVCRALERQRRFAKVRLFLPFP